MWTDDILDRIEALTADPSRDVELYDGEFLDPDKIAELSLRYSTKDGVLVDIEDVTVVQYDSSVKHPLLRAVVVAYCIHQNKRSVDKKVRGSIGFSATVASLVNGNKLTASDDHSEGVFRFLEILKEDQIPFVSVHAVRWEINLTVAL